MLIDKPNLDHIVEVLKYTKNIQRLANDSTYSSTLLPLNINSVEIENTVAYIRRYTRRARHAITHPSRRILDQEMLFKLTPTIRSITWKKIEQNF